MASSYDVRRRRNAAEDVCWTLMIMMELGGLELEQEWRKYLAGPLAEWCDWAVDTGVMQTG